MKTEIHQPLKNPSGKCNMFDIGWTYDPAVGKDYPLKPMNMLNEPCIKLPEPPVGQKWEYRGKGAEFEGTCAFVDDDDDEAIVDYESADGHDFLHYWQAVDTVTQKEEPQYRMLEEGEVIREGDELQSWITDKWHPVTIASGSKMPPYSCYSVRRPITPITPLTTQQKLDLAIDALEKARGWAVADEVLEQIL